VGKDMEITLSELETAAEQLDAIISEFDNAKDNSEALEAAIGNPFGRGELRDRAENFESRWDDKRKELNDGLKKIREHVTAVVDNTRQWDSDTAIALTG
jgi:phage-related minor tail protein